ncbi:MAG TPA: acetylglutamate kinase [Bryobacteraceae bacterium]|jgi:acetylglutamate kinase|nr:acetylglutamate kinase [Bryobacteraceae bacterium]
MRLLVKLGGALLDLPESRDRLAREIAAAFLNGARTVVVHGGGRQMTRFMAERGVESRFINGLRVSTPEVMDAVLKVLAGSINHELVAAFTRAGAQAVGLSGLDASLTIAEPVSAELGAVGKPVRSNPALIDLLSANGYLPVIACIAGGRGGEIYNVNADQMAVSCAAAFAADRLLFLTDVEGVRTGDGRVASRLTPQEISDLIAGGVATGGMQAKLEAARWALESGVGEIVIAPGGVEGIVERLAAGEAIGTRIQRAEAA